MKKHRTHGHNKSNGRKASTISAKASRKVAKNRERLNGAPAGTRLSVTGKGGYITVHQGPLVPGSKH